MKIETIIKEKNIAEIKTDNITVAEILRMYLNKQGIKFAAWKREHPTKPITFRIESSDKTVNKAVKDAVSEIEKELDKLIKEVKK